MGTISNPELINELKAVLSYVALGNICRGTVLHIRESDTDYSMTVAEMRYFCSELGFTFKREKHQDYDYLLVSDSMYQQYRRHLKSATDATGLEKFVNEEELVKIIIEKMLTMIDELWIYGYQFPAY